MIRRICVFLVWVYASVFYRHKVYGRKHFPKGGGIIASNHNSFLDPPLIGISCPGAVHFLARESLFHIPVLGWLIRNLNTHPVRRGKGNAFIFRKAMELVSKGEKVVIFPEGRRSLDGTLQKAQLGVAMLVQRTGCPVIPVYLHDTFAAWNAKKKFPSLYARTACVFGTPLHFGKSEATEKKEIQTEIAEAIMKKIAELRDWYLAGAKGEPP